MLNGEKKSGQTQKGQTVNQLFNELAAQIQGLDSEMGQDALQAFKQFYQSPHRSLTQKQQILESLTESRFSDYTLRQLAFLSEEASASHLEVLEQLARKAVNKDEPLTEGSEEAMAYYICLVASLAVDSSAA
tara:strand:- start:3120 stop:3515 length:396 start_codon:yes stop_codon:yes gene_type:complete